MAINITNSGNDIKLDINPAYTREGYNRQPQSTIYISKSDFDVKAQDADIYLYDGQNSYRFLYSDITSPDPNVYTSAILMAAQIASFKNTNAADSVPDEQAETWLSTDTTVNATSLVIKGSPGILQGIVGHNAKTSSQFIQIHDAASLPANGATPKIKIKVEASSNFTIDLSERGRWFSVGIVVCNSSTLATLTIGSADCQFSALYK